MKKIVENLETSVTTACDVLVCGGGFGGISAALAAARSKKRVTLLEKGFMLGGLGTAGLVTIYLPLCDGRGRQISYGIAEELLRLSISMGAEARYPENWLDSQDPALRTDKDKRFEVQYNPQLFAILAEQLLRKEGVEILYGTFAAAAHRTEDKIDAVIVENKSGRYGIEVGSVVDATGDCDIAHLAGAPTALAQVGNRLAAWYYFCDESGYDLKMLGYADVPKGEKVPEDELQKSHGNYRISGVDGKELSEYMQKSHAATLNHITKQRDEGRTVWPVTIATIPQVRMTRKLVGEYSLDESEMHTRFEDSIGMVSDWRKRGPVYEVPFRSLYSRSVRNLITAGRCVSVTDDMWDIMRVIPCCAVTGQAAGTAAAMTDDFATLDVGMLQQRLAEGCVVIHETDLQQSADIQTS